MGADLFGSLAESTCAALVVGSTSLELITTNDALYFPLMITAAGIIVSFITQFFATSFVKATMENVETIIKWQLINSTVLMSGALILLIQFLPPQFKFGEGDAAIIVTPYQAYACVMCGLWSGLIIGWVTELYTSNQYSPV